MEKTYSFGRLSPLFIGPWILVLGIQASMARTGRWNKASVMVAGQRPCPLRVHSAILMLLTGPHFSNVPPLPSSSTDWKQNTWPFVGISGTNYCRLIKLGVRRISQKLGKFSDGYLWLYLLSVMIFQTSHK